MDCMAGLGPWAWVWALVGEGVALRCAAGSEEDGSERVRVALIRLSASGTISKVNVYSMIQSSGNYL